jgi:hypothetical protein
LFEKKKKDELMNIVLPFYQINTAFLTHRITALIFSLQAEFAQLKRVKDGMGEREREVEELRENLKKALMQNENLDAALTRYGKP